VVSITNKTGGTVTLNGDIGAVAAGRGILVQNNSTGANTILFNGLQKRVSSGTSAGVNLDNNDGATISFANGGLEIATTTGAGFSATNGAAAIAVTGSNNVINAANGTGLNVNNSTIGAGGLNFRSISSGAATGNGISLDTTGATAGLTVTGDGTNTSVGGNATGGTISGKSGADLNFTQGIGVYLNNTRNVVLRRMTVNGTNQNFGIRGTLVNGFTLEYSTVNGTQGNAASLAAPENAGEGAIYFGNTTTNGIAGSGSFTSNVIGGAAARNLSVINTAGAATLSFKGNTFQLNQSTGNQALLVEARNGGTTVAATVGGTLAGEPNTFAGAPGGVVNFTGQTGTTMTVTMFNNTLNNTHPQNVIGGGSLTLATQGTMNFDVQNNTMTGANGSAVTLQLASAGTLLSGKFANNTIGTSGVANSGAATGNGIFGSFAGAGTASLTITGNTIRRYSGNAGMYFDNTGGSYTANFTILNNLVDEPGAGAFAGLAITNGAPTSSDTINVCADIKSNDFSAGDPTNNFDIIVGSSGANGGHTFNLPGYAGGADLLAVQNFIKNNNTNSVNTAVEAYVDPPATAAAFTGVGATCPTP